MKRKFKVFVNETNNHIAPQLVEHKKTKTYDFRNSGPGLGQPQKHGEAKPAQIATFIMDSIISS